MAKQDKLYFNNLVEATNCAVDAAKYLDECLNNYNLDNIKEMNQKIHGFEHAGDIKKHEMSAALAKAFVTPIDREDIALISHNIDDVSDNIEEVLQLFYVYQIKEVLPEALEFSKKLIYCCEMMKELVAELENFKKPKKLHDIIIELSNAEEECDKLYLEASIKILDHCKDTLDIINWRALYDKFEDCADACEHVGDSISTVVMKNS